MMEAADRVAPRDPPAPDAEAQHGDSAAEEASRCACDVGRLCLDQDDLDFAQSTPKGGVLTRIRWRCDSPSTDDRRWACVLLVCASADVRAGEWSEFDEGVRTAFKEFYAVMHEELVDDNPRARRLFLRLGAGIGADAWGGAYDDLRVGLVDQLGFRERVVDVERAEEEAAMLCSILGF